jgi:hypothetical protein
MNKIKAIRISRKNFKTFCWDLNGLILCKLTPCLWLFYKCFVQQNPKDKFFDHLFVLIIIIVTDIYWGISVCTPSNVLHTLYSIIFPTAMLWSGNHYSYWTYKCLIISPQKVCWMHEVTYLKFPPTSPSTTQ